MMTAKKKEAEKVKEAKNIADPKSAAKTKELLAVIRIRGSVNVNKPIKDTMIMLNLRRANNCVVIPENKVFTGMLRKAQNYVTWGKISQETLEKLVWKRGRTHGDKRLDKANAKHIAHKIAKDGSMKETELKTVFRLTPPSKGHKPIKMLYPKGACGYRGKEINELLKRMI